MRQAGFMAAAGVYALKHHVDRLAEDHRHAKQIAEALSKKDFVQDIMPVETNIMIVELKPAYSPRTIAAQLKDRDILAMALSGSQLRLVTHLDISAEMVAYTINVIESL
jgi:threonine aldolase